MFASRSARVFQRAAMASRRVSTAAAATGARRAGNMAVGLAAGTVAFTAGTVFSAGWWPFGGKQEVDYQAVYNAIAAK